MSVRGETWLWIVQRATAAVLAFAVLVHLVTLVYAARHGLSAAAILERTRGNGIWLGFYLVFATAAALHAGVGLRAIAREMTPWRGAGLDAAALAAAALAAAAGWRAALGLFA
jgi:succinate dehydrogenase subunit C